jgi:Flp pilus assembly protein TadG
MFSRRAEGGSWGEEGNALVEFAVVMPVVLLVMTGLFSISIVLYEKLELAQAVSSGARYLSMDRGDNDPCASTASKIYSAAPTLSQSKMTLSFNLNGTAYSTATCSGTTSMQSGGTATVTAKYSCFYNVYNYKGIVNLGTCSITESSTQVVQ